jgi:hypothetical protein
MPGSDNAGKDLMVWVLYPDHRMSILQQKFSTSVAMPQSDDVRADPMTTGVQYPDHWILEISMLGSDDAGEDLTI